MNIADKVKCPHCDEMIYVYENNIGRTVACAECGCLMQPERDQGGAIALHVMGQVLDGGKRRARPLVGLAVLLAVIACICSAFALVVATRDSRATNDALPENSERGAKALAGRVQRLEGEVRHLHATIGAGVTSGSHSVDESDVLNAPSAPALSEPLRTEAKNPLEQSRPASVKLLPPYQIRPGQPAEPRISVQNAVALICSQAGVKYDWDTSFQNTDPVCRRFVTPRIEDVPLEEALTQLTQAVGLHYTIVDNTVVLVQPAEQ